MWVGKCDDDTLINVPALISRLGPALAPPPPRALLGTIKWACYSDRRIKWEESFRTWECGRTDFAKTRHPGEPANLSLSYEGPFQFAFGWFFALPASLCRLLASCKCACTRHAARSRCGWAL